MGWEKNKKIINGYTCCLSRVPPAVCPSLLESATTVCTSFLQSLSTYVHTPTPHCIDKWGRFEVSDAYYPVLPGMYCCVFVELQAACLSFKRAGGGSAVTQVKKF